MISGYQHPVNEKIEVTGKALNAKGGAVVVVGADKNTYYLEGIEYWDKKIYGKMIKVSGILVVESTPKKDHQEPWVPEIKGAKIVIKSPKWQLVE